MTKIRKSENASSGNTRKSSPEGAIFPLKAKTKQLKRFLELPKGDEAETPRVLPEPQTAEQQAKTPNPRAETPEPPPAEEERKRPGTPPVPETPEGQLVIDEDSATAKSPQSTTTTSEPAEPEEERNTPRVKSTVVVVNKTPPDIRAGNNWTMADYGSRSARAQQQPQNWDYNRGPHDR